MLAAVADDKARALLAVPEPIAQRKRRQARRREQKRHGSDQDD
jgi:hypothetical protein